MYRSARPPSLFSLTVTLALAAASAGCGDKTSASAAQAKPAAPVALTPVEESLPRVASTPLAFTIDLPAGLQKVVDETSGWKWAPNLEDPFSDPLVLVDNAPLPTSVEDAVERLYLGDDEVVIRKEAIEGGFIVTYRSKDD